MCSWPRTFLMDKTLILSDREGPRNRTRWEDSLSSKKRKSMMMKSPERMKSTSSLPPQRWLMFSNQPSTRAKVWTSLKKERKHKSPRAINREKPCFKRKRLSWKNFRTSKKRCNRWKSKLKKWLPSNRNSHLWTSRTFPRSKQLNWRRQMTAGTSNLTCLENLWPQPRAKDLPRREMPKKENLMFLRVKMTRKNTMTKKRRMMMLLSLSISHRKFKENEQRKVLILIRLNLNFKKA